MDLEQYDGEICDIRTKHSTWNQLVVVWVTRSWWERCLAERVRLRPGFFSPRHSVWSEWIGSGGLLPPTSRSRQFHLFSIIGLLSLLCEFDTAAGGSTIEVAIAPVSPSEGHGMFASS